MDEKVGKWRNKDNDEDIPVNSYGMATAFMLVGTPTVRAY